jgi:hypothetical protein
MNDKDKDRDKEGKAPKFKIVDKRRMNTDDDDIEETREEPVKEPAPESKAADPAATRDKSQEKASADEPEAEKSSGESKDDDQLSFKNIVLSILQTVSTMVWINLGLVPNPQTNIVAKKMDQARRLIDLFETVYDAGKEDFPPQVRMEIDGLIQDMKANYVNQL